MAQKREHSDTDSAIISIQGFMLKVWHLLTVFKKSFSLNDMC